MPLFPSLKPGAIKNPAYGRRENKAVSQINTKPEYIPALGECFFFIKKKEEE
jgi:hypothetical protein